MAMENNQAAIEQFWSLLQSDSPAWILALYGPSHSGKSSLLKRLRSSLPVTCLPIHLDLAQISSDDDYEGMVGTLARQLGADRLPYDAWSTYLRRTEEIQELKHVHVTMEIEARHQSLIEDPRQTVREGKEESLRALEAARLLAHEFVDLATELPLIPIAFLDHWQRLLDGGNEELATWLYEDLLHGLYRWRPEFRLVIASDRRLCDDWLLRQRVRSVEIVELEVVPLRHAGPKRKEVQVDISVLTEFFKNLAFLDLSGPAYASYLVSRAVIGLLKDVDLEQAKERLAALGIKVKETVVPILVEKAKGSIRALAQWLREERQRNDVDLNDATAEILANQAEAVGQALDEAELDDEAKKETARQVKESLQQLGGPHSKIAEDYAQALLEPDMREVLMAKMADNLQTWRSQSIEARRNSLIVDPEQIMEGSLPGEQRIHADDQSRIIRPKQRMGPARQEEQEEDD